MIGLIDCNNFYASCERVFQPRLEGLPDGVLSNNDGCVIARSDELNALGVAMGTPDLAQQHYPASLPTPVALSERHSKYD